VKSPCPGCARARHPKLHNLKKAGLVIFIFSMVFTSLVSFFAVMIIPDSQRTQYYDNLPRTAMNVVGPVTARLLFQAFVVIIGFMILGGAVNTAIVGSNGSQSRLRRRVLTDWFRAPQKRYGTNVQDHQPRGASAGGHDHRQSRNVILLGEAYAFGVI
jgi:hypothetical protein